MVFRPGVAGNPEGKNGFSSGMAPFAKRAEFLLGKFGLDEIKAIAADEKRLVKEVSSWDGIVLLRLAAMINGDANSREEVKLLLDRKEGKAVERKEVRVIRSLADLSDDELAAIMASAESSKDDE